MAQKSQILDKYLTVLEKDPKSRVFAPLAEYYRKSGLLNQAIETLNLGIRHNPNYVLGHLGLAFCYFENGNAKRSYDILNPLVDSNRDNLRMLRLYSDICLELGKSDEALENLKYLLFINPKDSEAAEKVKSLENDNKRFGPIKFNLQDVLGSEFDTSSVVESVQFNVEELDTSLNTEKSFDEWTKVDLSNEQREEESLDSWSMNKKPDFKNEISEEKPEELERHFKVEKQPSQLEHVGQSSPVITHTLVDLYCNQGYLDKAKDLLEKILELNPNDLKTKLKLQEVDRVIGESFIGDEFVEEEIAEENVVELSSVVTDSEDKPSLTNESVGRDNLMSLFDKKFNTIEDKEEEQFSEKTRKDELQAMKIKVVEEKLWAFHRGLKAKAKTILSV